MTALMAPTRQCSRVNGLSSDAPLSKIPSHQATSSAYGNQSVLSLAKARVTQGCWNSKVCSCSPFIVQTRNVFGPADVN